MRDGRKILARQLVEQVVFLHTGNLAHFDMHYLCIIKLSITKYHINCMCKITWEVILFASLVVRVLGYRSGGPGSIPGTTRKKKSSGSGTGCTEPREYKLRSYLIEK
jgi:hypothetical protein